MPNAFRILQARGLIDEVIEMPSGAVLEGAGDCLWDGHRGTFWRARASSDKAAAPSSKQASARPASRSISPIRASTTSTPRSARCRAAASSTIRARSRAARAAIERRVAPSDRIALDPADAARFAADAVCFGRRAGAVQLQRDAPRRVAAARLCRRHHAARRLLRSGGSACCLTLRLDNRSRVVAQTTPARAAAGHAENGGRASRTPASWSVEVLEPGGFNDGVIAPEFRRRD